MNKKLFLIAFMCFVTYIVLCSEPSGGPYVPTPQIVVDKMLELAQVDENDFLIDLGSGDGVIVHTAALQYKARGLGVDINKELVKHSNETAKKLQICDLVTFKTQDIFKTDISSATVITAYLLPEMMEKLRPIFFNQLKPGTRIVSHDYHVQKWAQDKTIELDDVPEKIDIIGSPTAIIHLWTVPARVAGEWKIVVDENESYTVDLYQTYQLIEGSAFAGETEITLAEQALRGNNISFVLSDATMEKLFYGKYKNKKMSGTVVNRLNDSVASWSATLLKHRQVVTVD